MDATTRARIPSVLLPLYNKLMSTEEGRSVTKRIKVKCGICKLIKFYSIHQGITKVASVFACENCRHLYQTLRRTSCHVDCNEEASCFKEGTFATLRCKGCLTMQLLDSCPHPDNIYAEISASLSIECRNVIRGRPLKPEEMSEEAKGEVGFQVFKGGKWVDIPKDDEHPGAVVSDEEPVLDESSQNRADSSILTEQNNDQEPEINHTPPNEAALIIDESDDSYSRFQSLASMDIYEEEAMIDDPEPIEEEVMPKTREVPRPYEKVKDNFSFSVKSSERIRRKKKIEYFSNPEPPKKMRKQVHGPDGKILKNGIDLCDCLQKDCLGCHFPCPKCRSPKCGNECRVNRRWYYEKVDVEGTNISWKNLWVPKI